MALTKIGKEGITGISNAANATFLTATSAEGVTLAGTLAVTGVHTVGTNAVATSEGGAVTHNITQGLAKAWLQHAGSTPLDSFNISGLTDNATGNFTLAFSNAMGNALYAGTFGGASAGNFVTAYNDGQFTASGFNMTCFGYNGASLADPDHATGIIAGDLA